MSWNSTAIHPDTFISEYKDYCKDAGLAELLTGKTVAYVCPSPHLEGSGGGAFIDGHDVVVRAGSLHDVPENMWADYGRRTDVVVHSFNELEISEARRDMNFLAGVKFVMCAMVSYDFLDSHEKFFDELRGLGAAVQNVDDAYLYGLCKEVGTICNVGFLGLVTLLNYDVSEVFVTGMTFYNMGKYGKIYNSDYYRMVTSGMKLFDVSDGELVTPEKARADLHDQQSQIEHFKKMVMFDKRLRLDGFLTDNFL